MPAISSIILSSATSELRFAGGGRTRVLTVLPAPRARVMRVSVDPRDGRVRLTLPSRARLRDGLRWAEQQRTWIEAALAALPAPRPIVPGVEIPCAGATLRLVWQEGKGRTIVRDGDRLIVGGALESLGTRVLRWLRAEAARVLTSETMLWSERAGVVPGRVSVGDPRARWGSCSASGDIRYSWRLILAPSAVREATVVHEVGHRLHMNHGPEFHAAVRRLLGRDPRAERQWLRQHGASLYWFGRDG